MTALTPSRPSTVSDTAIATSNAADADRLAPVRAIAAPGSFTDILRAVSPLTWQIAVINVFGLIVFVMGVLALNDFRAGLVDARIAALGTEGEIIAGALVESALGDPDLIGIAAASIDPAAAEPILRRLAESSGSRLRLYDSHGQLLLDSRALITASQVQSYSLPAPGSLTGNWPWLARLYDWIIGRLPGIDLPRYREAPGADGSFYPEVTSALLGTKDQAVRANSVGRVIVSVAVPIQRLQMVQGALLLSSEGPEIELMLRRERLQIAQMFVVALVVSVGLSILISGAIVRPIRHLAKAAQWAKLQRRGRAPIPRFDDRSDEIGQLARSLSDMTDGLYERIDAIERFAADVSHEIKNPLTSLHSAVETLDQTEDPSRRATLLRIIKDDVNRIDRLITDIAAASRLDGELSREARIPVDLAAMMKSLAQFAGPYAKRGIFIDVTTEPSALGESAFVVMGMGERLAQVFRNVIDNALSFSPDNGSVHIELKPARNEVLVAIEDQGPGIPPESLERVFERFYTSRDTALDEPGQFGKHSGLGLAIARQIVSAHHGRIWAENRNSANTTGEQKTGARFVIVLPR